MKSLSQQGKYPNLGINTHTDRTGRNICIKFISPPLKNCASCSPKNGQKGPAMQTALRYGYMASERIHSSQAGKHGASKCPLKEKSRRQRLASKTITAGGRREEKKKKSKKKKKKTSVKNGERLAKQ
ncbi:hypothetical protein CEXT_586551 [Caerostris extrusa]|uniref:Uncharacterized protein n=1 Tax=Caerostris extrusa TaxID=172846 RepID=A0AAV4RET1_CAEEX|nr:hypothetical protein CEXT_586551 [Caerostris extrusa]